MPIPTLQNSVWFSGSLICIIIAHNAPFGIQLQFLNKPIKVPMCLTPSYNVVYLEVSFLYCSSFKQPISSINAYGLGLNDILQDRSLWQGLASFYPFFHPTAALKSSQLKHMNPTTYVNRCSMNAKFTHIGYIALALWLWLKNTVRYPHFSE